MIITFALWDWPTAAVLLGMGFIVGLTLFVQVWPQRLSQDSALPTPLVLVVGGGAGVTFFLILSLLRAATEHALPVVTAIQWVVFIIGGTIGVYTHNQITRRTSDGRQAQAQASAQGRGPADEGREDGRRQAEPVSPE